MGTAGPRCPPAAPTPRPAWRGVKREGVDVGTAVVRAVRVLELLASSEKPVPLSGITAALGAPKSSVHGVLRDLISEGFVEPAEPGTYKIGMKAFEVGSALLHRTNPMSEIAPELRALTRRLQVTSHFAVLAGTDVVYLWKEDPPVLGVQLASAVGARLPAQWTSVGKACLAWLDAEDVAQHLDPAQPSSDGRHRTRAEMAVELAEIRSRGYAVDEGDTVSGIECVAAPVFDLHACCGAVGVSFLKGSKASLAEVAADVVVAAGRATAKLGGLWSR